jgi:hypothetical protein
MLNKHAESSQLKKNNGVDSYLDNEDDTLVVSRGPCPATRFLRHPDYNDDGSRVATLLDTIFDRSEKIFRILATIFRALVLLVIIYELEKLLLPSFPPVEGNLNPVLLPVLWSPVRDGAATVFHKCLEWIS